MPIKHNKKRNVGLIQEFLARHMAISMVENKPEKKDKAIQLVGKHFKLSSDLHKEWMTFHSLVSTQVNNKEVAHSLISEAKKLCRTLSEADLERAKTTLIHDINHQLGDDKFWGREVKNYKLYATVQILMNEWRNPSGSLGETAALEDKLMEHLTRVVIATEKPIPVVRDADAPPDVLVIKLMTEKFNSKYSKILNERQKKIVSLYLCAQELGSDPSEKELRSYLKQLGESVLFKMEKYAAINSPDIYLQDKLKETREFIKTTLNLEILTEDILSAYLNFAKLEEELIC